ncbi:hypothetical protein WJX82_001945 [Trebouxia sp. C0006]
MNLLQAFTTAAFAGFVALILFRFWPRFGGRQAPLPPRGYGLPLIGDTVVLLTKGPKKAALPHLKRLGSIYRTWIAGQQFIHVTDIESVKYILNAEHDLVEVHFPATIQKILGPRGFSTLHGKAHTQIRKIMVPAFSPKTAEKYIPQTLELAKSTCADWAATTEAKGEDGMKAYTFQESHELILGFPKDYVNKAVSAMFPALFLHSADILLVRMMGFFEDHLDMLLAAADLEQSPPPKHSTRQCLLVRSFWRITVTISCMWIIHHMRLEANANKPVEGVESPLERYIKASKELDDCPTDMEHYMLELRKLREEQRQVIAEHGSPMSAASLAVMPYADATVKETLRILPVVSVVGRTALKTFDIGGYTIPKGSNIQLHFWKAMEDDARWQKGMAPDLVPSRFNPDRWLGEEGRRAGSWLPLGYGPRMCIGYGFALQEMKIMLAVLARGYDWQVDLTEPIRESLCPFQGALFQDSDDGEDDEPEGDDFGMDEDTNRSNTVSTVIGPAPSQGAVAVVVAVQASKMATKEKAMARRVEVLYMKRLILPIQTPQVHRVARHKRRS